MQARGCVRLGCGSLRCLCGFGLCVAKVMFQADSVWLSGFTCAFSQSVAAAGPHAAPAGRMHLGNNYGGSAGPSSDAASAQMLSVLTAEARTMVLAGMPPAQRWRLMEAMKDEERAEIVVAMGLDLRKEAAAALEPRVWERTLDIVKNSGTYAARCEAGVCRLQTGQHSVMEPAAHVLVEPLELQNSRQMPLHAWGCCLSRLVAVQPVIHTHTAKNMKHYVCVSGTHTPAGTSRPGTQRTPPRSLWPGAPSSRSVCLSVYVMRTALMRYLVVLSTQLQTLPTHHNLHHMHHELPSLWWAQLFDLLLPTPTNTQTGGLPDQPRRLHCCRCADARA